MACQALSTALPVADAVLDHRCSVSSMPTGSKVSVRLTLGGKRSLFWGHGKGLASIACRDVHEASKQEAGDVGACTACLGHNKMDNTDEKGLETKLALFRLTDFVPEKGIIQERGLILHSSSKLSRESGAPAIMSLQTMSKEQAMSLSVQAAQGTTGWTTGSGLQGPSVDTTALDSLGGSAQKENSMPWPLLTRSPRRRMRVEFTCNKCSERTLRAINPDAYKTGTVFVQCGGCMVFHKLVDNLNLFHEFQGPIFEAVEEPGFAHHQSYDILGLDDM